MKQRSITINRETKETKIRCTVNLDSREPLEISTSVPFLDHLLHAMSFHGGFSLIIEAKGDVAVDAHHLVEDTGLVLGDALAGLSSDTTRLARFSHALIPMDEALAEVAIDVCGRSTLVFQADFPQKNIGTFDPALLKEFLNALSQRARISLHATIRKGENSHHMAEALFKALGKALAQAFNPALANPSGISTKGTL